MNPKNRKKDIKKKNILARDSSSHVEIILDVDEKNSVHLCRRR
jgi:hypothetical protein